MYCFMVSNPPNLLFLNRRVSRPSILGSSYTTVLTKKDSGKEPNIYRQKTDTEECQKDDTHGPRFKREEYSGGLYHR